MERLREILGPDSGLSEAEIETLSDAIVKRCWSFVNFWGSTPL